MQKFFFAMMLKSRSHHIADLQERCFSHSLKALAVNPKTNVTTAAPESSFPYLKRKDTTSDVILQEFFLI
jgi:hypothetical protein